MNINQNKWVSTSPSRTVWTGKFLCLKIKKNRFIWHNTFYRLNLYSSHVLQILNVSIIKGTWMILIKSGSCHIVLVCIESLVVYLYEIITKVCIPLQRLNESILFYFKYSITSQLKIVERILKLSYYVILYLSILLIIIRICYHINKIVNFFLSRNVRIF